MERQSVKQTEPDKDQFDSLAGFLRSDTLPDSARQEIYSTAWLPCLLGRDLAREAQS
jgi:hypothetical protein